MHFDSQPLPAHKDYTTSEATTDDNSSALSSPPEVFRSSSASAEDSSPLREPQPRRRVRHSEANPLGNFGIVKASIESLGSRTSTVDRNKPHIDLDHAGVDLEQFLLRESQIVYDSVVPDSNPHCSSEPGYPPSNMDANTLAASIEPSGTSTKTPARKPLQFLWHRTGTRKDGKLPSRDHNAELATYTLPDDTKYSKGERQCSNEPVKLNEPKSKSTKGPTTRSQGRGTKPVTQTQATKRKSRAKTGVNVKRKATGARATAMMPDNHEKGDGSAYSQSHLQLVQPMETSKVGAHQRSARTTAEQTVSDVSLELTGLPDNRASPLRESYHEFERHVTNVPDDAGQVPCGRTRQDQASQTTAAVYTLSPGVSGPDHGLQKDSIQDVLFSMLPDSRHHSPLKPIRAPLPTDQLSELSHSDPGECIADDLDAEVGIAQDRVRQSPMTAIADLRGAARSSIPSMTLYGPKSLEVTKPDLQTATKRSRDIATQHTTLKQDTPPIEKLKILAPRVMVSTRPVLAQKQHSPKVIPPQRSMLSLHTPMTISVTKPSVDRFEFFQPPQQVGLTPLERFAKERRVDDGGATKSVHVADKAQMASQRVSREAKHTPPLPYVEVLGRSSTPKRIQSNPVINDHLRKRLRLTLQDSVSSSCSSEDLDESLDGSTLIEGDWSAALPPHQQLFYSALNEVAISLVEKLVVMEDTLDERVTTYHQQGSRMQGAIHTASAINMQEYGLSIKQIHARIKAVLSDTLVHVQGDARIARDGGSMAVVASARQLVLDMVTKYA